MRNALLGALAALAMLGAGCGSERAPSALATPEDIVDPPSDIAAVPVDLAFSAASAYITAFNNGDVDAVMALLPAGTSLSDSIAGEVSRDSWERRLAWSAGQGTRFAKVDCTAPVAAESDRATVIRCETATLNAPIQAVGAEPVPTTISFSVTRNGIVEVREEYGRPDFLVATEPFMRWMEQTHPADADAVGFGVWDSVDEAREQGQMTAEYARLWAGDLEASCRVIPGLISADRDSYLDDC